MGPMQGKLDSSQFDFRYTEQFSIPGVTSVFFSSCDSDVGDSLEFNQANRGSFIIATLLPSYLLDLLLFYFSNALNTL